MMVSAGCIVRAIFHPTSSCGATDLQFGLVISVGLMFHRLGIVWFTHSWLWSGGTWPNSEQLDNRRFALVCRGVYFEVEAKAKLRLAGWSLSSGGVKGKGKVRQ